MVLIELPEDIRDKNITKLVKRLNEAYEKAKWDKFKEGISEVFENIKEQSNDLNIYVFILSHIAEETPSYISDEHIKSIVILLDSRDIKVKMNAIVILGSHITAQTKKGILNQGLVDRFIEELKDENPEIRQNLCVFLEDILEQIQNSLLAKLNFLIDPVLKNEKNPEVLRILKQMFDLIQPKLSLPLLITYISKLLLLYSDSDTPERSDLILTLIEREIPILAERKKKNITKKEILHLIEERLPITRIYDIKEMAKEEQLGEDAVEEQLKATTDEEVVFTFTFSEKNRKYLIEFERDRLIAFFKQDKIKIDKIYQTFQKEFLGNKALVPLLIKSLVGSHLIRGYISKEYYYPNEFLIKEIQIRLQREGKLELAQYTAFLSAEFFDQMLGEVIKSPTYDGCFDKSKKNYFTMKSLIQEIEQMAAKYSIIDLSKYSDQFEYEGFLRLEEFGRKNLFTSYHKKHQWLSNLGYTRIQTQLRTSEQIGVFNPIDFAKKLEIPVEILKDATKDYFKNMNGFWNSDYSCFYFAKYIRIQIQKIQNNPDVSKREQMIAQLAKDLNVPKDEINKKVNEKLTMIAEKLNSQEELEILPLLRQLQMEQAEFMEFVDNLDKPYLVIGGKIIFSSERIQGEKSRIKEQLRNDVGKLETISMEKEALRLKCSKALINEIFKSILADKEVNGIWISEDEFITEKLIERKILNMKDYIPLMTLIEKFNPTEQQIQIIEKILLKLLDDKKLNGKYDSENKIFQSQTANENASYENEKLHFVDEANKHNQDMEVTYNSMKEILLQEDLTPSQIEQYEKVLEEAIRRIIAAEAVLKRIVNNANSKPRKDERNNRDRKSKSSRKVQSEDEPKFPKFEDDEIIAGLFNTFANWKTLIFAIEQKAGQLVFLKKKMKADANDEESRKKYKGLLEYLGFSD